MDKYKSEKGFRFHYILLPTIITNIFVIVLLIYINSYVLSTLLKVLLTVFDVYQLYYILMGYTLKYVIDDSTIKIIGIFGLKKWTLPIGDIKAYNINSGKIKGVKLTGYGSDNFALGKSIIDKMGIVNMFVTSNKNIFYLKTQDMCYGISPEDFQNFEKLIKEKGVEKDYWETTRNKNVNLFKDKNFLIALILTTITIGMITIIPLILYFKNGYPENMPLSFDTSFTPLRLGTGKQFAFKQMSYGVLNTAVLFFLYYAAYFYSRYDKKSAYKFIYIALFISVFFLIMLLKILNVYL